MNSDNVFIRTEMLIGSDNLNKLKNSYIAIFGLGGVGGYVFEALVRSGVKNFDLFDNDVVDKTNLNRQILALTNNIGKNKVEVAKERGLAINPDTNINTYNMFVLRTNIDQIDFKKYDYVVDAIDTVDGKLAIILEANKHNISVISSMGTGNKLNPLELKVKDIYQTKKCPLAKVMRKELKKLGVKNLKVCYSEEDVKPCKIANPPVKNNGRPTPSSIAFVPSTAGLIIASEIVKDIINMK